MSTKNTGFKSFFIKADEHKKTNAPNIKSESKNTPDKEPAEKPNQPIKDTH